ncbi:MAG: hypothetical protein HYV08_07220 [Deltaproteobacteria bacterium]|nr:hypothetical protein [Deltaproteobacteria bacterium]
MDKWEILLTVPPSGERTRPRSKEECEFISSIIRRLIARRIFLLDTNRFWLHQRLYGLPEECPEHYCKNRVILTNTKLGKGYEAKCSNNHFFGAVEFKDKGVLAKLDLYIGRPTDSQAKWQRIISFPDPRLKKEDKVLLYDLWWKTYARFLGSPEGTPLPTREMEHLPLVHCPDLRCDESIAVANRCKQGYEIVCGAGHPALLA